MNKEKKYTVVVGGLTVIEHHEDGTQTLTFSAGGAVYHKTGQHLVLAAEAMYTKHADDIAAGMDDFTDDMMKLGIQTAGDDPKVQAGVDMVMGLVDDDDGEKPEEELTPKQRRRRGKRQRKGR